MNFVFFFIINESYYLTHMKHEVSSLSNNKEKLKTALIHCNIVNNSFTLIPFVLIWNQI